MSRGDVRSAIDRSEAVLFDLFHTLTALESTWSSGPTTSGLLGVSREAWNEQLLERSRERLTGEIQDPATIIRTMAHAINPSIPEDVIQAAARHRIARFAGALHNVPEETLMVLRALRGRGKKLGLISNADVTEAAAWDESPMAPLFDSVVLSCRVGWVKPDKEIYERCIRELRVAARECIFVGDGGSQELEGAKHLGMTAVMVTGAIRELWPDRIEARSRHADFVVERLGELLPAGPLPSREGTP